MSYGGTVTLNKDISTQISKDLTKAEILSLPILLVLLVLIFSSLAAAVTPLAIGVFGILGAFTVLRVITLLTDVSVFSLNIVTMIGLGLAIDYSLFIVSRFREELPRQANVEDALARTMATAGRTVAFSGITVAVSLASLLLFPEVFLKSMGYGGVAVVLVDVLAALTVLPALLGVLGPRVDALRLPLPWRRTNRHAAVAGGTVGVDDHHGPWYRLANSVMRRPVVYAVTVVVLLLAMGAPFLKVTFGGYSAKVLPASSQGRIVTETLARDFPGNATAPIQVVVQNVSDPAILAPYVDALRAVPGVTGAAMTAQKDDAALVQLSYDGDPIVSGSQAIVRARPGRARCRPGPPCSSEGRPPCSSTS